mmetsp:Transcript_22001/g.43729  ORF Transcript_22001/g.43729 Transcript_22001/m.43729 type:complete len:485 (-) Transcript_22001:26-1480(-)
MFAEEALSSPTTTTLAAFSIATHMSGVKRAIGIAEKYVGNPVFNQSEPWEARIDNGYPNIVPPFEGNPKFQAWYGTCGEANSCDRQFFLYANSDDGLTWNKPDLGMYDLTKVGIPGLSKYGKHNNIIIEGGGIGVFRDPHATSAVEQYKAIGPGCWNNTSPDSCLHIGDTVVSADGLNWEHVTEVPYPKPQRWDTHSNVFFDEPSQKYVLTTRSYSGQREVAVDTSPEDKFEFNTSRAPPVTMVGSTDFQLYAQITWPWLNTYLGIVMVFDAAKPTTEGRVHCRLAWADVPSPTLGKSQWQWMEGDFETAPDFIPLGKEGSFDSHICFAAASPFRYQGQEHVYYMGGNGPHNGPRNSSLALATFRQFGLAALQGSDDNTVGTFVTRAINVTQAMLTVSADFVGSAGYLQLGVKSVVGEEAPIALNVNHSVPLTTNSTSATMHFIGGCGGPDFTFLIGKQVILEGRLLAARLFTIGFGPRAELDC